jgi:hypothetical protein
LAAVIEPGNNGEQPLSVDPDHVYAALDRILSSRHFSQAPKKKRFLRLVCDFHLNGRSEELNEYLIGREVFNRGDSYDPAVDPIVRVAAHDVRKKLSLYYENEGATDPIRLQLPLGSYVPVFIPNDTDDRPLPEEEAAAAPLTPARDSRTFVVFANTAILILVAAVAALLVYTWSLRTRLGAIEESKVTPSFGEVWDPFTQSEDLTLLVISNPAIYRFSNPVDPEVIRKDSIVLTPEETKHVEDKLKYKFLMKQKSTPSLVLTNQDYTGMGEAIGLHRITDLFRMAGKSVVVRQSRTASAEDLKNHNVVLLGSVWVNQWSGKLPTREDFVYTLDATIENRSPQPGEETVFRPEFDERTGELITDYALITVKPNISNRNTVMVVAGVHSEGTEAAAEFVTNDSHLVTLNGRLADAGNGNAPLKYYQALLKVGVENGIPTTISLITLHGLTAEPN